MPSDKTTDRSAALQFDHAVSTNPQGGESPGTAVVCANCGSAITTEYFHVAGQPVCANCRGALEAMTATPRGWRPFLKAGAFGVGAAIAGAVIYYAVIAITGWEIGIVAILIGYMVGYMVRKGAGMKGGRRFQILALVLTYWAVGLAYSPIVFKTLAGKDAKKATVTASDSIRKSPTDSGRASSSTDSLTKTSASTARGKKAPLTGREWLLGLGALLFLTFALPVVTVVGSLPSGLLSGLIILIGLRQAWQMTRAPQLNISGPYKVAASSSTSPA